MIHFPLVILPLLYGTQVDNFTSVNPWIKRGYPHLLFMGCPEHLNVKSDHIRAQGLTPTGTQVRTASSLSSPDRLKWGGLWALILSPALTRPWARHHLQDVTRTQVTFLWLLLHIITNLKG